MRQNFQKRTRKELRLTEVDRKRLAAIGQNLWTARRKCKFQLTLANTILKAVVSIAVYGKDEDEVKEKLLWHQQWFAANSSGWKISSIKDMRAAQEAGCEIA